jgi:hypothetical protein
VVEHRLGKTGVRGSIPRLGTIWKGAGMVTVNRKVVTTETAKFSQSEIEYLIRERMVAYKGVGWEKASISVYQREMPVTMGQIDTQYEIVAECVLTKTE